MRVRLGVICLFLAVSARAEADVVTLAPVADTTLFSEDGAISNGAGQHMFCGRTQDSFDRRALLRFDIAAAIPDGSTITDVTLTLNLSRTRDMDLDVELHRVTAAWGEASSDAPAEEGAGAPAEIGDATWTHSFYATTVWSSAGGDYDPTASATTTVPKQLGPYTWSSAQMVADVQAWVDTPADDFGWLIDAPTAADRDTKRFDTREHPTPSVRPQLEITFTPPAGSGACCAADGVCSVTAGSGNCSGDYQGAGTACSPNPCPEPVGSCCLPDAAGTCVEQTETSCSGDSGVYYGALTTCSATSCPVVLTPFLDPLPLPAIAQPTMGAPGGAAEYRLDIVELQQQLHSELPMTTVWGYDDGVTGGTFPGPTIEAATDQGVTVVWANDLRDETNTLRTSHVLPVDTCPHGADDDTPRTVTHLHGGHVQAAYDGYPEDTFLPGEQVAYQYPNWQQPATIWYHDHALGITRLNVYMGLAGFYLIRDPAEAALGLPAGTYEIPLVIQDRTFEPDGSLSYPATWQDHYFGDVVMVNGKVWPYLDVAQGKYRFRVLNGSNSRVYHLSLSDGATFEVIGTDGGLLEAPVTVSSLLLASGERADIVIDFAAYSPNTDIILQNDAPAPYPGDPGVGVIPNIMQFHVTNTAGHTDALPVSLTTIEPLLEADAVESRDFLLEKVADACSGSAWTINGLRWDDITETPQLGTSEVWTFVNNSGVSHPMHMHLVFFQVLDRQSFEMINDVPTPIASLPLNPHETGWKDTVLVGPGEMVRVIARFEDFIGLFPYHCHVLEHEDHEMMRQFQTVTTCGDGARGIPGEECDDGNTDDGDGCSSTCTIEPPPTDAGVSDASVAPTDASMGATDAAMGATDAGVNDAGAAVTDAGVTDAGVIDAGAADAAEWSPDAGESEDDTGGCGCRSSPTPGGVALFLLVLLFVVRRRPTG